MNTMSDAITLTDVAVDSLTASAGNLPIVIIIILGVLVLAVAALAVVLISKTVKKNRGRDE